MVGRCINAFSLLSVISLSVAYSLPSAFTFEELATTRIRFSEPPYSRYVSGEELINDFVFFTSCSVGFMCASIFSSVFFQLALAMLQTSMGGEDEKVPLIWWKWARWIVGWILSTLVTGSVLSIFAFNRMIVLKFPDFAVEDTGSSTLFSLGRTFGFIRGVGYVHAVFAAFTILILGFAHTHATLAITERASKEASHIAATCTRQNRLLSQNLRRSSMRIQAKRFALALGARIHGQKAGARIHDAGTGTGIGRNTDAWRDTLSSNLFRVSWRSSATAV